MLANGMALAGNFGTGEVTAHDLAAGLQGAVVKDEEKDKVVWQEYLSNVLKKRGAEWRPLFTACSEHNCVTRLTWRIHVFGVRHLSPGGALAPAPLSSTACGPKVVLIEGLADADALIPDITRKRHQAADRHPGLHRLAAGAHARLPAGALQPGVPGDLLGQRARRPASSSSTCRPTSSSACRTCEIGTARAKQRERPRSRRPGEQPAVPGVAARSRERSIYEQIAERAGERGLRHVLGAPLRAQPRRRTATALAAFELGRALRDEDDPPRLAGREPGPRGVHAPPHRGGARRRRRSRSRSSPWSAPFTPRCSTGELPAMTDAELASLRRRSSKLTLMPYSYFRLSSQSGYGAGNHAPAYFELLWEALNGTALGELPRRYLSLRRPPPARGRHAPLDGRGDRGRAAGPHPVGPAGRLRPRRSPTCATPPSRSSATASRSTVARGARATSTSAPPSASCPRA